MDNYEIYYIDFYNTLDNHFGYNAKSGGQNGGSRYTNESREKMSKSHKDLLKNPIEIEKLRSYALETWSDKTYRESRCGENHQMYGKHHNDDTKQKMRDSHLGKKYAPRRTNSIMCVENQEVYPNATEAAKKLGLKTPHKILEICRGNLSTYNGYSFVFLNNVC